VKRHALLAAAIAVLGFAEAASAADMPTKMPVKAPMVAPMYNWSGFYLGGDVGWQGSSIGLSSPITFGPGPLTYSPHHSSVAFGGFAGYQHQFGQFVLGIEGGYIAATGNVSLGATPSTSIFFPGGTGTGSAKLKDIWSIGGRAGIAMGPTGEWLPYLAGGYASGRFHFEAQTTGSAAIETADATAGGAYFGGGIDWAAWRNVIAGGDVILGVEYRHYAFRTTDTIGSGTGFSEIVRFDPKTDVVMGRVSFKFGR
jgi:outer membrane immunogenic protein